jgi:prophage regulatory protein
MQDQLDIRLLRLPAVEARTGLTKDSIYLGVRRGEFPKPVRVGKRRVAWRSDELERWIQERPRA